MATVPPRLTGTKAFGGPTKPFGPTKKQLGPRGSAPNKMPGQAGHRPPLRSLRLATRTKTRKSIRGGGSELLSDFVLQYLFGRHSRHHPLGRCAPSVTPPRWRSSGPLLRRFAPCPVAASRLPGAPTLRVDEFFTPTSWSLEDSAFAECSGTWTWRLCDESFAVENRTRHQLGDHDRRVYLRCISR